MACGTANDDEDEPTIGEDENESPHRESSDDERRLRMTTKTKRRTRPTTDDKETRPPRAEALHALRHEAPDGVAEVFLRAEEDAGQPVGLLLWARARGNDVAVFVFAVGAINVAFVGALHRRCPSPWSVARCPARRLRSSSCRCRPSSSTLSLLCRRLRRAVVGVSLSLSSFVAFVRRSSLVVVVRRSSSSLVTRRCRCRSSFESASTSLVVRSFVRRRSSFVSPPFVVIGRNRRPSVIFGPPNWRRAMLASKVRNATAQSHRWGSPTRCDPQPEHHDTAHKAHGNRRDHGCDGELSSEPIARRRDHGRDFRRSRSHAPATPMRLAHARCPDLPIIDLRCCHSPSLRISEHVCLIVCPSLSSSLVAGRCSLVGGRLSFVARSLVGLAVCHHGRHSANIRRLRWSLSLVVDWCVSGVVRRHHLFVFSFSPPIPFSYPRSSARPSFVVMHPLLVVARRATMCQRWMACDGHGAPRAPRRCCCRRSIRSRFMGKFPNDRGAGSFAVPSGYNRWRSTIVLRDVASSTHLAPLRARSHKQRLATRHGHRAAYANNSVADNRACTTTQTLQPHELKRRSA